MNRLLLEQMLQKMKKLLKEGKNIGNLKIGALYALGSQLEAVFYFIGHELGTILDAPEEKDDIIVALKEISELYHLGKFKLLENNLPEAITFVLEDTQSSEYMDPPLDKTNVPNGICSFEAGVMAGFVEKLMGKHVFAQQLESKIRGDGEDKFILVFSNE